MKVKIKKIHKDAVIPKYAKSGDAGMDLTCTSIEQTNSYVAYKTGLTFEIPEGYVGLLFPRSSNSNKDLILSNSVGVIDSGYRGEVELRFKGVTSNISGTGVLDIFMSPKLYNVGDRVGQLIIIPYPQIEFKEVDELSITERNTKGYGSSGA